MEIADGLAIINNGRLEQMGAPADLYDHPTNDFVLSFLGPVTEFDGTLVRPHDLVVHAGDDRVWVARAVDRELAVPPPRLSDRPVDDGLRQAVPNRWPMLGGTIRQRQAETYAVDAQCAARHQGDVCRIRCPDRQGHQATNNTRHLASSDRDV